MARFFDPEHLSPDQKRRWTSAIAEYARVQKENIDMIISAMAPEVLEHNIALVGHGPSSIGGLRANIASRHGFVQRCPGDPSSALFARILSGLSALPYPPPTSGAYPWYEVIEDTGPFTVVVAMVRNGSHDIDDDKSGNISINQCRWVIDSGNASAGRLIDLDSRLAETAVLETDVALATTYSWSRDLLEAVLVCYAEQPEMIVHYGHWNPYCLCYRSLHPFWRIDQIEQTVLSINEHSLNALAAIGSVFDVRSLMDFVHTHRSRDGNSTFTAVGVAPGSSSSDDWILHKTVPHSASACGYGGKVR